jgi:type II secretory ATPase GspE/PulE/Tfp pilus assembly ATPase PilB-like protein
MQSMVEESVAKYLPEYIAFKYNILPFKLEGSELFIYIEAFSKATDEAIRRIINLPLRWCELEKAEIMKGLFKTYRLRRLIRESSSSAAKTVQPVRENPLTPLAELVNAVIEYAILYEASDIHFEPLENFLQVRYRIDGIMRIMFTLNGGLHGAVLSRLKIMAGIDIAEKRLPQDGRILYSSQNGEYDIRIATLPTLYGEKAVLRILEQRQSFLSLSELGFDETSLQSYRSLLHRPYGLIICCGATGCGKTTTMYASLQELSSETINIVTIEDPVERAVSGIFQCPINLKAGFDFSHGLKAILRQDPDVILVGEIRDEATAATAVRAAITGHLVLATLHTNNAVNSIVRLLDMGVKPFLLADALIGVLSQRLVRRLCPNGICARCSFSGYRGRTGIYELLAINDELRQSIRENVGKNKLYEAAERAMVSSFADAANKKVAAGITSRSEVERVIL